MGSARKMWSVDTYVNAAKPKTNYYESKHLGLKKWDAPDAQYAYITFPTPFQLGAKITSAKLTLTTYAMKETGAHTINVALVAEKMSYSRVTWNSRPDYVAEGMVSVTKSGALPGGTVWEFDVMDLMQQVSDGRQAWYGFRVTTSDTQQRNLYAQETSLSGEGPWLSVTWADNPDEPQGLTPNEGVVGTPKPVISFDYVDVAGDTGMGMIQVQTSSVPNFINPTWDSGQQKATRPVAVLEDLGYPGAPEGQKVYYRVRVADGAGLWSRRWSSTGWFIYKKPGTLTITSLDPANPKFSDSTPDISWTFAGAVQTAYRVTLARRSNTPDLLWDTGKIASTDTSVEVPSGVLRWDDTLYRLVIWVWDDQPRVTAANSTTYRLIYFDVELDEDLASAPVNYVEVEQVISDGGLMPFANVYWDRATSADAYEIARIDGEGYDQTPKVIARVTYQESIQRSGRHRFQDRTAPGNRRLRYIVRPITNGKRAGGRGSNYITLRTEGVWLTTVDPAGGSNLILLVINGTDQGTWELPEEATAHQVAGSDSPVIIREPHRGYSGSIQGLIVQEDRYQPYLNLDEKRDRFFYFKRRLGVVRLIAGDLNIPVRLANMNIHPTPDYVHQNAVSFDFWQDGEVHWDVRAP